MATLYLNLPFPFRTAARPRTCCIARSKLEPYNFKSLFEVDDVVEVIRADYPILYQN